MPITLSSTDSLTKKKREFTIFGANTNSALGMQYQEQDTGKGTGMLVCTRTQT